MLNYQKKLHETLLKLLNNIGVVGAIITAVVDIICVIILVVGIKIEEEFSTTIIFSVINAVVGLFINILLRYQGQKYAEIENEQLIRDYYADKVKKKKINIPMGTWQIFKTLQDIIIKGGTTSFSIFGIIYLSIEGSKNPIQILISIVTLLLFICFGLISMNSAYCRFYNIQIPYMQNKINKRNEK